MSRRAPHGRGPASQVVFHPDQPVDDRHTLCCSAFVVPRAHRSIRPELDATAAGADSMAPPSELHADQPAPSLYVL